jgi:predicted nicotinamide N-methyase
MTPSPFDTDLDVDALTGSLSSPPAWVNTTILLQRMDTWPRWAHLAWFSGILRARGEKRLASYYRAASRAEWLMESERRACLTARGG